MRIMVSVYGEGLDQIIREKFFEWPVVPRFDEQLSLNGCVLYVTQPPCHEFDEGYVSIETEIALDEPGLKSLSEENGWVVYPHE